MLLDAVFSVETTSAMAALTTITGSERQGARAASACPVENETAPRMELTRPAISTNRPILERRPCDTTSPPRENRDIVTTFLQHNGCMVASKNTALSLLYDYTAASLVEASPERVRPKGGRTNGGAE